MALSFAKILEHVICKGVGAIVCCFCLNSLLYMQQLSWRSGQMALQSEVLLTVHVCQAFCANPPYMATS